MKYIKIGRSDVQASAIAAGCMRIDRMQPVEVERFIEGSLEAGINLFDHADIYGGGECERIFGQAMKQGKIPREKVLLQSKCGIREGMFDFSKEYIIRSVEQILERLDTQYLDLFILHRPDTLMEPEEIAEAFDRLRENGKVKEFGVSNMNSGQIELLSHYIDQDIVVNQLQFSLAHTQIIDSGLNVNMANEKSIVRDNGILEYSRLKNITIQTWSSLQYGYFKGTFLGSSEYVQLNKVLERMAEEKKVTPAAIAIAWIISHPAKMQAVVGTTNPQRLGEIAKAPDIKLNRQEWYELYLSAGNQLP